MLRLSDADRDRAASRRSHTARCGIALGRIHASVTLPPIAADDFSASVTLLINTSGEIDAPVTVSPR